MILFLVFVQSWWALFNLHAVTRWTFFTFLVTMLFPVLLFTLSALMMPDFSGTEIVDMRAEYFRERQWFFGLLVLTICASAAGVLLAPLMLSARFLGPAYLVADVAYLAGALLGLFSRSEATHRYLAVVSLVVYSAGTAILAFLP